IRVKNEKPLDLPGRRRRVDATQFDFTFSHRGSRGEDREGEGRLFIPAKRPREHMPLIVHIHYEIGAEASARFLERGWAVMTQTNHRSYNVADLMGNGVNSCVAMAQLPRRMPFVDQQRLMLFGISAGGYHALMASSFIFPVNAVVALVPPLNLKYNINYLLRNDEFNVDPENPDQPLNPPLRGVTVFATETAKSGRPDLQDWRPFGPTFRTRLITFPTLITYFTGDGAVPVNQLSKRLAHEIPHGVWPEGFSFEMDRIVDEREERLELLDALDPRDYQLKVVKVPPGSPTVDVTGDQMTEEQRSRIFTHSVRWSKTKRFSIYVADEGYPEIYSGHSKYHHRQEDISFFEHHLSGPPGKGILTDDKLVQLMERFSGRWGDMGRQYDGEKSWPIARGDHPHLEAWYVTSGLEAYIDSGPAHEKHLRRLYRRLPGDLKVLDIDTSPEGRFDRNPGGVLRYHMMMTLLQNGDIPLARNAMRGILSK
ncbi:MAG: hypothetical protein HXS50_05870, partial [Theionarchaea archaeon]|nr:hypothetical protein [Theionarchaea archaeon]